jgi:hypothetical protein
MFEIAAVIVCMLIMCSAFILLAVLLVVWAAQRILGAAANEVLSPADEHAWRVVKPIREEMRDACAYRSTGAMDEPRQF